MNLSERMHHEVADVRADHAALVRVARARARARQRRRQLLRTTGALVGAAAAVTAITAGASWLASPGQPGGDPAATAPADPTTAPAEPLPVTGRAVVAALLEVVPEVDGLDDLTVVPGSLGGSGDELAGDDAYGRLELRTGGGEVELGVNVQRWSTLGTEPGCTLPSRVQCESEETPAGDVVSTYVLDDGKEVGQLAAELVSEERDLRVVVIATTAPGSAPVASLAQLRDVATWPGWTLQLPASFAEQVAQLPSYDATG